MSENLRGYTKALYGFDAVVRRVPEGAWEQQSPCEEWKALDVLAHVTGIQLGLSANIHGQSLERPENPRDVLGGHPRDAWAAARDAVLEALDHQGALQHIAPTPFGDMPVDQFLAILTLDTITHTWDLAKAAGLDAHLDADLVRTGFERIRPLDGAIRMPGVFGPKQEAPNGADEATQLMAFLGRKV